MDLNNIVKGLANSGAVSGFAGGLAGTAVAGALSGKKGKKMAKSALKVGALAAVGGLAYTAYRRYRQGDASAQHGGDPAATAGLSACSQPPAQDRWAGLSQERFAAVVDDADEASGGLLLIRAMIAAAAADGHMDSSERERIFREAQRVDLTSQEKAKLFGELSQPLDIPDLVRQVPDPETAVEVYAASLVAIDETRHEAQTYLMALAAALDLPDALVGSIHAEADMSRQGQAA